MRSSSEIQIEIDLAEENYGKLDTLKKEREEAMMREWSEWQQSEADRLTAERNTDINKSKAAWVAVEQMLSEYGDDIAFLWNSYGEAKFLDSFKSELENAGYIENKEEREIREYRENTYRKKKINGTIRTLVYERDGYQCVNCGVRKDLSLDHIHPESKGGATTTENLQTLCRSCNSKKGVSL